MTTIPASVKAQLDADWTGAGGAEPPYYVAEDYRTNPPLGGDSIWILDNTDTDPQVVNDKFVDEFHTIDIVVTATSADRLKEIGDEVVRILNATTIADITYQRYKRRRNVSGVDVNNTFINQEIITYDLREQMKASASAHGAGATGDFTLPSPGNIVSAGAINFKPSGDTDDYISFTTTGNVPKIDSVGGSDFELETDTNTISVDQLAAVNMLGSANAAWVPCNYLGVQPAAASIISNQGHVQNVDGTDFNAFYSVPIPMVKDSLKLYISGTRVQLSDADGTNFVTSTILQAWTAGNRSTLDTDGTNKNAKQNWDDTFTAVDCSSYDAIDVHLVVTAADGAAFDMKSVSVRVYYAT